MKSLGMVRTIDHLGRVRLPKELCDAMDLPTETPLEILAEDGCIMLRRFQPACVLCGSTYNVEQIDDKSLCQECVEKVASVWSAHLEKRVC